MSNSKTLYDALKKRGIAIASDLPEMGATFAKADHALFKLQASDLEDGSDLMKLGRNDSYIEAAGENSVAKAALKDFNQGLTALGMSTIQDEDAYSDKLREATAWYRRMESKDLASLGKEYSIHVESKSYDKEADVEAGNKAAAAVDTTSDSDPAAKAEVKEDVKKEDGVSVIIKFRGEEVFANAFEEKFRKATAAKKEADTADATKATADATEAAKPAAEKTDAEKEAEAKKQAEIVAAKEKAKSYFDVIESAVGENFATLENIAKLRTEFNQSEKQRSAVLKRLEALNKKLPEGQTAVKETDIKGLDVYVEKVAEAKSELETEVKPEETTSASNETSPEAPKEDGRDNADVGVVEAAEKKAKADALAVFTKQAAELKAHHNVSAALAATKLNRDQLLSLFKLYDLAKVDLDIVAFKAAADTLDAAFTAEKTAENTIAAAIKDLQDELKELDKPTEEKESKADSAGAANETTTAKSEEDLAKEKESKQAADKAKQDKKDLLLSQIGLYEKAKAWKAALKSYRKSLDKADAYSAWKNEMKSASMLTWMRSLVDSRRAVAKVFVATLLSAVTAGAASVITVAAAASVLNSVAVALAAYAAARLHSTFWIARRHAVSITDLHADALSNTDRVEIAAAVVPTAVALAAPYVFAASVATQVLSYCGTVALRAAYSVAASLGMSWNEIAVNSKFSAVPVSSENYLNQAKQDVRTNGVSEASIKTSLKAFKGQTIDFTVDEKNPNEIVAQLFTLLQAAIANKTFDITNYKELKQLSIKPNDDQFKGINKLNALLTWQSRVLTAIETHHVASKAKDLADEANRAERHAVAQGVAVQ